ncbi:hypothetical protein ABZX90_20520 [Streptomyces sp. NPDC002935]|uniref:hypothetical protein n=1 Tax=unclassified Streptomyces TaxID=2593676 RepID=UPI00332BB317
MERGSGPSSGLQVVIGALLLVVDLLVIAWLLYGYGITGWADSYDEGNAPEAPGVAWQGMWILVGGAVVTGGGLLALRLRITGSVQLIVLGIGALMFHSLAARA